MSRRYTRRSVLGTLGRALAASFTLSAARRAKAVVQKALASVPTPRGYDPTQHKWLMAIDINKCIGCGLCVEACKRENGVPEGPAYFRTWVERYIIKKPEPGSTRLRGETLVDSPNGGMHFPPAGVSRDEILHSFFVPKLCNLCENSPCSQACPVGATFKSPDGVILVDPNYCVGCGFCVQACPYGCRFINPVTKTAEKCTLCYHRITQGLRPACVEVCPGQARIFGDVMNAAPDDPLQRFIANHRVMVLKPQLGTGPRVKYAGLDMEVR